MRREKRNMNEPTAGRKGGREGDWEKEQGRDPFSRRRKPLFHSGVGGGSSGGLMGDWVSQVGGSLGFSDSAVTEALLLDRMVTHIKMTSDVCIRRLTREQQRCTEGGGETRTHKPGRTPHHLGIKSGEGGKETKGISQEDSPGCGKCGEKKMRQRHEAPRCPGLQLQ